MGRSRLTSYVIGGEGLFGMMGIRSFHHIGAAYLWSDWFGNEAVLNTYQSIFSIVVIISPRTASTPIRRQLHIRVRKDIKDVRVLPVSLHATRQIASMSLNTHALRLDRTFFLWAIVVCFHRACASFARWI